MAITRLLVSGYRSVKDVCLKLGRVNVIVGPNGCGKSNLYRAMFLVASAASGQFARNLAGEGGMPSVLWAGARSKGPVRLRLGVKVEKLDYELSVGLPQVGSVPLFPLDPKIKSERIFHTDGENRVALLERKNLSVNVRDVHGKRIILPPFLAENESVLFGMREPERFPEIIILSREFLSWRFYHQFRTDASSPLRQPATGVFTPTLAADGKDLAATLLTIQDSEYGEDLEEHINAAFPGAELYIHNANEQLSVGLQMPGIRRPLSAAELSDGTLQYLCLLAALLSVRAPSLIALNEPETSIHPDLLAPLAKLVATAAKRSQLWITTHSQIFADLLLEYTGAVPIELEKIDGETQVVGLKVDGDIGDGDEDDDD